MNLKKVFKFKRLKPKKTTRIVVFGNCQASAIARMMGNGLPSSDYQVEALSNNARTGGMKSEKLFLTHNHPATKLLLEVCSQIKKASGLPLSLSWIDMENDNIGRLPEPNTPISPYDVEVHGYAFDFHENWFEKGKQLIELIGLHYQNTATAGQGAGATSKVLEK